ncbi:hypothetical protein BU17DRAFT_43416 [Hysterangium stoloniferum]|nr:hypothetical protein BU17DRAFT_43416 [Hysterangium stoloniferum]
MLVNDQLSSAVELFRNWLQQNDGFVHPNIRFVKNPYGLAVHAAENLSSGSTIISCPIPLAITPESSKKALSTLRADAIKGLELLSERELICTYLIVHLLFEEIPHNFNNVASFFIHLPYIKLLPPVSALRTPLYFTNEEFSLLCGTNLYGATLDRKAERETEWIRCRKFISSVYPQWEEGFTWERYLIAATYLSSRAFPSTLLSQNPSLITTDSSHPVLLPGVDSLNHSRGHPVSWEITSLHSMPTINQVSLVVRVSTLAGNEVFNNYGLKPNSELILGYGFSLPENPDDTIVLKIGGVPNLHSARASWEVGRYAKGIEGMWEEMKAIIRGVIASGDEEEEEPMEWELEIETADTLTDMLENKVSALPVVPDIPPQNVRKDVLGMIRHYVEGQNSILESLIAFAEDRRNSALQKAA